MTEPDRGTDRAGRRSKRFLTPLQKYEIFLQLIRQEVTMAEAAERWQVDRKVIMRIRTVAKEGALEALSSSRPGVKAKARDYVSTFALSRSPTFKLSTTGPRPFFLLHRTSLRPLTSPDELCDLTGQMVG
jgi:transposase